MDIEISTAQDFKSPPWNSFRKTLLSIPDYHHGYGSRISKLEYTILGPLPRFIRKKHKKYPFICQCTRVSQQRPPPPRLKSSVHRK
jgi:hypothetical protein